MFVATGICCTCCGPIKGLVQLARDFMTSI
jgi:hypothetical protein